MSVCKGPGPLVLGQVLGQVLGPGPGTDFWYALNSTGGYVCGTVRYSNALSRMLQTDSDDPVFIRDICEVLSSCRGSLVANCQS